VAISRELRPGASDLGHVPSEPSSILAPEPSTHAAAPTGAELVQVHFDFVWRLLRRLGLSPEDADDAAQQVFMTATQKLERITPGNERTFLYGVALRVCSNLRRKVYRHREGSVDELGEIADEHATPDEAAQLRDARALLDEILASFPEELRRVLVLAHIEQFELSEIASAEGIPQGTAASRLRRARALFAERLAERREKNPFRQS